MAGKFDLAVQFAEAYPQRAARILEELLPQPSSAFIDAVPDAQSIRILSAMLPYHAAKCIAFLSANSAAKYLVSINSRTAANILAHVSAEQADAILNALPRQRAVRISMLLNYEPSMVGAWLEPEVLTLPAECRVLEAKQRLTNERYIDFHRIYVVDAGDQVVGFVRLVNLLNANDHDALISFVEPIANVLRASTTLHAALKHPAWEMSDYVPVIDHRGKFLGVIRFAALRAAGSKPQEESKSANGDTSTTVLMLAETCYLGLAEVMNATLGTGNSEGDEGK